MVGNIVDVGWATIKSGCLPITAPKALVMTYIWAVSAIEFFNFIYNLRRENKNFGKFIILR